MKIKNMLIIKILIPLITVTFILSFTGCSSGKEINRNTNKVTKTENSKDEHEGHDHKDELDKDKKKIVEEHNEDDGHDHGAEVKSPESDKKEEDEHEHISLSDEAIKLAGIKTDRVKLKKIDKVIELIGEIGFDEDKYCKVVPRFSGIVKKVNIKLGDFVNKGDTLAVIESNESLTTYSIKSSFSGRIIKKNITIGEYISNETNIFEIADLANVWVNLVVYVKNSNDISIGQKVNIESIGTDLKIEGRISYISSFINKKTRNLIARVIIPNRKGLWYPGTFVNGIIKLKGMVFLPVIPINAVQMIEDKPTVFVPETKNDFEPVVVVLGKRNKSIVHIIKGLKVGDLYVSKGAFEIKAKLITSDLDSHAGHGH